jgi:hypothetical protein
MDSEIGREQVNNGIFLFVRGFAAGIGKLVVPV